MRITMFCRLVLFPLATSNIEFNQCAVWPLSHYKVIEIRYEQHECAVEICTRNERDESTELNTTFKRVFTENM